MTSCQSETKPEQHAPESTIETLTFNYQVDSQDYVGYIAWDSAVHTKRPGIIVVHEWWGHNAYARKRARMLAENGYVALALDMFGDGKQADHPDEAAAFAHAAFVHAEASRKDFEKALEILKHHPQVDSTKTAALGYCFGGGVALYMAREGVDLDGVVTFHGALETEQPADSTMHTKLLICTGADDPMASPEVVQAFRDEMDAAGVDYNVIVYPGAKHAFTNPMADSLGMKFGMPLAYQAAADTSSWASAMDFLKDLFR